MKIVMAPLRGVTTATFRRVFKQSFGGIDRAMAPFISTSETKRVPQSMLRDILPQNNIDSYPITPQIIGNNPNHIEPFVSSFMELGFDEINLNLGCPAPMVTKKGRGSGFLQELENLEKYLAILSEQPLPYSVKVRLGLNSKNEILRVLPLLEKYHCKEITVHARLGEQGYSGRVDINAFNTVASSTTLPIIYNGDILSIELYHQLTNSLSTPIEGVMLGRGILVNPFLAEEIKSDSIDQIKTYDIKRVENYVDALFTAYSEQLSGITPVLGRMKEIWRYLQYSFPEGRKFIKKIMRSREEDQYKNWVKRLFETPFIPPKEYPDINF